MIERCSSGIKRQGIFGEFYFYSEGFYDGKEGKNITDSWDIMEGIGVKK